MPLDLEQFVGVNTAGGVLADGLKRAHDREVLSVQVAWFDRLEGELDNLRAALEWAIDTDNAEVALRIAGGMGWPHWLTGRVVEGKRWVDDAFRCGVTEKPKLPVLPDFLEARTVHVGVPVGFCSRSTVRPAEHGEAAWTTP